MSINFFSCYPAALTTISGPNTRAGITVGGLLGYNWQSGNLVYGIEGDLNWVDGKSSATIPSSVPVIASSNLHWMSTVRGRLGLTYNTSTLFYVTGGVAVARFSDSWGDPQFGGSFMFPTSDYTRTGWTAGGGVEHISRRTGLAASRRFIPISAPKPVRYSPLGHPIGLDLSTR